MRMMRFALLAALLALFVPDAALAHGGSPLHSAALQAGPHALRLEFYNWPARSGQPAELVISLADAPYAQRSLAYEAWLVPPGGGAPVAVPLGPDPDNLSARVARLQPAAAGDWTLRISARGADGGGAAELALPVAGAPAIPVWLGWVVGLTPGMGLILFLLRERRRLALA